MPKDFYERLKGFNDGVKAMKEELDECRRKGDDKRASEIERVIEGSLNGIEKWIEKELKKVTPST